MRYPALFLLTCLGLYTSESIIHTAQAEEVFKKTTAFWLRGSRISISPEEPVTLYFSIVDKEGKANPYFGGSIHTSVGANTKLTHIGNGIYEAVLSGITLKKVTDVQITIKGKGLSKTWKDRWTPKASGSISIKPTLSNIVLSKKEKSIPIDITVKGPDPDKAVLRFKASTGKVKDLKNLGNGNYRAQYIPYEKNLAPKSIIITVSDQRNPQTLYGATSFPASSKINLPVDAMPNSKVQLDIDGTKSKIITTDENGKATFDVLVPPNIKKATLITIEPTSREDEVDLKIPIQRRLVFIPPSKNLPCNQPTTIRYFALDENGKPDSNNKNTISVNVGSVGKSKHIGDGLYEAIYTPNLVTKSSKVTLRADDEKKTKYSFSINAMRPERLILQPEQKILGPKAKEMTLKAQLLGARHAPLSDRKMVIKSSDAKLKKLKKQQFGRYTGILSTELNSNISLIAHVRDKTSKNPVEGFVIDAQSLRFAPKSAPFTMIIVSHDGFGAPVAKVPFNIKAIRGDVTISQVKATNKRGFAYVTITPGKKEGPVLLRISNDHISSDHLIFQMRETTAPSLQSTLISGTSLDRDIVSQWRSSIAFLQVPREESEEKSAGKITPKKIKITHSPSTGRPGGEARLDINVLDKKGKGLPNVKLKAFSSLGKISAIKDLGGGNYEAIINIPNIIQSDIDIEVVAGRNVREQLTFPVSKGEARKKTFPKPEVIAKSPPKKSVKKDVQTKAPVVAPSKPPKQRVQKPKKPFTWPSFQLPKFQMPTRGTTSEPQLSLSLGTTLGIYNYIQNPFVADGQLYSERIAFSRDITGSSPANNIGFFLRARGNTQSFLPSLSPFLMLEARTLSYNYAVQLEEFNDPIRDWNSQIDLHIIPRYSFNFSDHRGHLGARLGYTLDDVMLFQQKIDGDRVDLSISSVPVQGPSFGLDLSYSPPIGLDIDINGGVGLAGGIYRKEAGIQLSYNLGAINLEAGYRWNERTIIIEGSSEDLGDVRDDLSIGFLGVGRSFK